MIFCFISLFYRHTTLIFHILIYTIAPVQEEVEQNYIFYSYGHNCIFFLLVISSQVLQLKYDILRETILDQTGRWLMWVFLHMWSDLNALSHKFSLILKCVTLQREKRSFVFHGNFKGMENDCDCCDSSWTRNSFLLTACLT